MAAGEPIRHANVFYAMPNVKGQLVAQDFSKYAEFVASQDIPANGAVMQDQVKATNAREAVYKIVCDVKALFKEQGRNCRDIATSRFLTITAWTSFCEFGLIAIYRHQSRIL